MNIKYQPLLNDFTNMCKTTFGSRLTGVYLHGSMAMGCFHEEKSDIDLIVIVQNDITDAQKMRFMEQVVQLNEDAPPKGLEVSVVKRRFCRPFVYPTPYELHFSPMHLKWFQEQPDDYIKNMNGEDKDLAAHFTILNKYGIVLYGEAIGDVFGEVPTEDYLDSIRLDIENAADDILDDPVYITLNLCRVLGFLKDGLYLSKEQGGRWGLAHLSETYHALITEALICYRSDKTMKPDRKSAKQFAEECLRSILLQQKANINLSPLS